jgi:SWIM zinc finger
MGEIKYEVELAMIRIDNYWCQKSQLTGIPCDHLLAVCLFRRLDYTQYVSPYSNIKYYINTWSGHWRSYGNRRD